LIRRSAYIFVLLGLFLGVAKGLHTVGFWSFAGLPEPHGYEWMGVLFLGVLFLLQNVEMNPVCPTLQSHAYAPKRGFF